METAQPLTGEQFRALWPGRRRAFHLELKDIYGTAEESAPFTSWLLGQPDDHVWHDSWLTHASAAIARGTTIHRARVVSEPWSDYIRWAMTIDRQNIRVGEEIRYLPRHEAAGISLPPDDYWLFDDDLLVFSLFNPDGTSAGFRLATDRRDLDQCRSARDEIWFRAIPHDRYRV
ncbi:DUF6879 family protein [Herbidospora cretacea]|uniref:DUF6879 family protein n=1 Tax=Herbidospora cretacea TaxID=28444 RepID=UPI000774B7EF|nr:DUF6879 family protein [Herbidospora cretacea]